jgi:hypothetical protein
MLSSTTRTFDGQNNLTTSEGSPYIMESDTLQATH